MAKTAYDYLQDLNLAEEKLKLAEEESKRIKSFGTPEPNSIEEEKLTMAEQKIKNLIIKIEAISKQLKFTNIPLDLAIKRFIDELYEEEGKVYEVVYEKAKWARLWMKTEELSPHRKPKMADVIYLIESKRKIPNLYKNQKPSPVFQDEFSGTILELKKQKGVILISHCTAGIRQPEKLYLVRPTDVFDAYSYSFVWDCISEDYHYLLDSITKSTTCDKNSNKDFKFF